ncbi:putative peptidase S54, rhomboid domain-containing protein [Rosa chinensis]|uniref:Putative peptidase S54, rhomboid domain-containing protein n=1 Tax=Rosa chinensis TaxID=74649 RepID=A0A2P6PMP5_ROSCH|nr:putative peptidase S54, rhomboid domain-containing protein [Rosa chinensis]
MVFGFLFISPSLPLLPYLSFFRSVWCQILPMNIRKYTVEINFSREHLSFSPLYNLLFMHGIVRRSLFIQVTGVSGAVNAIMLLDIFLHPTATLYFDFIIPVPAMLLGIFLIGKDILRIMEGNSQILGSAYLGGAAAAAIAWARLRKGGDLF